MNKRNKADNETERLLAKTRLAEPSRQLKEQITEAARNAWRETRGDVHWMIALRRLGLSAAAAVLIVLLADYVSEQVVTKHHRGDVSVRRELPDLDALPEAPYGALARYHVMAIRKPSRNGTSALREYSRRMQELLDEAQHHGVSDPPDSIDGSSHVLPVQPRLASYS